MTAMTLKVIGEKTAISKIWKNEVIVLPLRKYQALLSQLEDLEDLLDSQRAMAEYRAGQGRPFSTYLKERRTKRRVSNHKR